MTKEDFKKEFAGRLSEAIGASGYSGRQVARICGLDEIAIYNYTSPKYGRLPGTYTLQKLCRALDVSADWLLFGEVEPNDRKTAAEEEV